MQKWLTEDETEMTIGTFKASQNKIEVQMYEIELQKWWKWTGKSYILKESVMGDVRGWNAYHPPPPALPHNQGVLILVLRHLNPLLSWKKRYLLNIFRVLLPKIRASRGGGGGKPLSRKWEHAWGPLMQSVCVCVCVCVCGGGGGGWWRILLIVDRLPSWLTYSLI